MQRTKGGGEGDSAGPGAAIGGLIVLVAGGSALGASQTDRTGPVLAFAAAILVAVITWYATDRRQTAALAAEEKRQTDALAAEDKRHTDSLSAEAERHAVRLV